MKVKNKLFGVLISIIILITIGVVGYMNISNYSFVEALYMTVITFSTVGFGEVHPSTDSEKLFTIFLIFTSIGIFAYIVSVLTEYIANGRFFDELKLKRMQTKIHKLSNHSIVCGYGRNGRQAASKLISFGEQCVIIEDDEKMIVQIEEAGILYIKGDATNDEVLKKAGIKNCSNLIATLPSDADNLFIILSSRQYNNNATLISRASNDTSERKLRIAGADNVIMPDKIGGDHMASLVVSPDIIEFVDHISLNGDCDTNLEEIIVNNLPKEFINRTLRDLDLRKKTGCSVIGLKTDDNDYVINPAADIKLAPNTKLIVLGNMNQILKLKELY
ncbi:MAG: potassium channel protein [Flavobacteriaceae bacterium]